MLQVARKERPVHKDHRVLLDISAWMDRRVLPDPRGQPGLTLRFKDLRAIPGPLGLKEPPGRTRQCRDLRAQQERLVPRAPREIQEILEVLEARVPKVLWEHKVHKATPEVLAVKAHRAPLVTLEALVHKGQPEPRVAKVLRAPRATPGPKDHRA